MTDEQIIALAPKTLEAYRKAIQDLREGNIPWGGRHAPGSYCWHFNRVRWLSKIMARGGLRIDEETWTVHPADVATVEAIRQAVNANHEATLRATPRTAEAQRAARRDHAGE
jgi:hypothetical protein